ncbi:DUF6059 family protein [Streptomyces sp. NPDC088747]|uniref:DUF6059 family protein n=1 Tax=Streptomyces sp. NPDC088747 TaxID=3365886 RepID=UPI00381D417A
MGRLLRGARQALTRWCLRPLWQILVVFGSIYTGPAVYRELSVSPASPVTGPLTRRTPPPPHPPLPAQPQPQPLSLSWAGPPPGHPERLCPDLALSAAERRLARDLWPAHDRGDRAPEGG